MTGYALRSDRSTLEQGRYRRFAELVYTLAGDDVRLRYRGTLLGAFWSIARPLALFGVLYLIFTQVVRFDHGLAHYPLYLLLAIVLWQHFSQVTRAISTSLVGKGALLRKLRFPRLAVPFAESLGALATLGPALFVVLGFMLAGGITPGWGWLELVPLVLVLHVFATAVGIQLAVLYVRFRDVSEVWSVVLQLLFYASAVLYPVTLVPEGLREVAAANPLVAIFTQGYHALVDPSAPSAAAAAGGAAQLAVVWALIALTVLAAAWSFAREAPHVAERV
jgi:ABC-2 type transport system permease protein